MKKYYISKSQITELLNEIKDKWNLSIRTKRMLAIEMDKGVLLISDELKMIKIIVDDGYILIPFLGDKDVLVNFPSIEVDMGAIKAICNGASVMRPGIVKMDQFKRDDIVIIKDVNHKQYLAVGIALIDSDEAINQEKGYVIKNLHYVGDKFWEAYKVIKM